METGVTVSMFFIITILMALIFSFMLSPRTPPIDTDENVFSPSSNEVAISGNDFHIHNYLKVPIHIKVELPNKELLTLIDKIQPSSKRGVKISTVLKYLRKDTIIKVYVHQEGNGKYGIIPLSNHSLDVPEDGTIKRLHIGMVTSRWIGSDHDQRYIPGLNAVQGRPWIKIHNLTDKILTLNENIRISPGGTLRYAGRDHFGVRIGTIFSDSDGIFPDFNFKIPATDVYYGVTSDIQQSLFGGYQLETDLIHENNEPHHLLENGWYGGPDRPQIEYGYLPKEGPESKVNANLNRWGEVM